jgi:hypothetical protein
LKEKVAVPCLQEEKVNKRRAVENDTQIILVWNFLFIVRDEFVKENKFFFKNVSKPAQVVAYQWTTHGNSPICEIKSQYERGPLRNYD